MDEEMSFPNPVVRTDLPVKRRRWPRILLATAIVLLLTVVFLPQILNMRLGRALLKQYLGYKFNADVAMIDFHTSWFGGTSAVEIWIKTQDGHIVGCRGITTEASLLKLIRGKYDLGNCTVTDPLVDWVVDYGDVQHSDTYNRLAGRPPVAPGMAPPAAPRVSGNITIRNGTINVLRGQVVGGTLQTTYQSMRFTGVGGTLSAKTAADPWQIDLSARAGDDKAQPGMVTAKGSAGFGGGGTFATSALQMALKVDGQLLPAPICLPVFVPILSADDVRQAVGPTVNSLKLEMQSDAGKLTFAAFDVTSSRGQVHLRPIIDLNTSPPELSLAAPATITLGIPGGEVRRQLAAINPFLATATGEGVMILRLDSLKVLLARPAWRYCTAAGEIELHEVKLATPRTAVEGAPDNLLTQLSLLTGSTNPSPVLNAGPTRFSIVGGQSTVTPGQMTLDDTLLSIAGNAASEGSLKMGVALTAAPRLTAAVPELAATPGPGLVVPITGTVDAPTLDLDSARAALSAEALPKFDAYLATQLAQFKNRQAQAAKQSQENAVDTLIQQFRSTTRPGQ